MTKIEWTDKTWNPITGCDPISPGCKNCYAAKMARRLAGRCGYPAEDPFKVTIHPDRFNEPSRWKKPRRVFVCSMGDLFHGAVPDGARLEIFKTIESNPHHIFQILTKRPENIGRGHLGAEVIDRIRRSPNLWIGVSAENQIAADLRYPILARIPAAVRFVSIEPMIGPVDLRPFIMDPELPLPDWIILGSESGPLPRPFALDWARQVRDQCCAAEIPFFFKQGVINGRLVKMPELDGRRWAQYPPPAAVGRLSEGGR